MEKKITPLLLWLFGVVFALLPLWFDHHHEILTNPNAAWVSVILHAELMLIALALLGDSVARSLMSADSARLRGILGLASFVTAAIVINDAAQIRELMGAVQGGPSSYQTDLIWNESIWSFVAALVLSSTTLFCLED